MSLWRRDNVDAMPLELYPFRFLDDVTKKWVRARYVAELHVIAERYTKWEITGPPEIRSGAPVVMFSPSAALKPLSRSIRGHLPPVEEPPPDHGPTPDPPPVEQPPPIEDQLERFLVLVFLRRTSLIARGGDGSLRWTVRQDYLPRFAARHVGFDRWRCNRVGNYIYTNCY